MDILSKYSSQGRDYTKSITISKYLQTKEQSNNNNNNNNKSYSSICGLFIDLFDPTCSILDKNEKKIYTDKLLIEIASNIDEHKEDKYDIYNYSKIMKSQVIQYGLQCKNNVSSLLYLSDYYKVTSVLYMGTYKLKVVTSDKDRKLLHILYTNGSFIEVEDAPDYTDGEFKDLGECFVMDIDKKDIYNKYLDPISKYKATDIVDLAKEVGISLESKGRKKIKKVLYDEINLYHLNN